MRILLDECVHVGVKAAFPGHTVKAVSETAWRGSKDGPLLSYAQAHFEVFVTIDRKLERQHNLGTPIALMLKSVLASRSFSN